LIARYTLPEMGRIWSEENKLQCWLRVEIAAAEAMAELGMVPREAAAAIRKRAAFDVDRVLEIEKDTRHDVIAFLTAVGEHVGPEARWLHYGMTSSDCLDTALALQLVESMELILASLRRLKESIRLRAQEHKRTPCVGRTHGVHAEVTTFGLKLASWHAQLERDESRLGAAFEAVRVGKISGAVGTFAHLGPEVEERVCRALGLEPDPVSTQIVQRDRHAEYLSALASLGTALDRFATEIRHLQRSEVREVEEPFGKGQKGSSAMPHKRNPVTCEQISGLTRLLRTNLIAGLENVPLWHERDISHSSVERVILPDSSILAHYMLVKLAGVVEGMQVFPERMMENLGATRGVIFSQPLLLALARAGVSREDAYAAVQRAAMTSWKEGRAFQKVVMEEEAITSRLESAEIERAFDLEHQLRNVDTIFERVFS
jgi:adenylosuccinate lyase